MESVRGPGEKSGEKDTDYGRADKQTNRLKAKEEAAERYVNE